MTVGPSEATSLDHLAEHAADLARSDVDSVANVGSLSGQPPIKDTYGISIDDASDAHTPTRRF